MKECLILVGPDKWCQNHINFVNEHKESLLLYDKFPKKIQSTTPDAASLCPWHLEDACVFSKSIK